MDNQEAAKQTSTNQPLTGQELDAIRRHICDSLDFDYAIIDIIRDNEILNLITFAKNNPAQVAEAINQLQDAEGQPIATLSNSLAEKIRLSAAAWVGQAINRRTRAALPYVIVPIIQRLEDGAQILRGFIRILSFDAERQIEESDLSSLKHIGQHLASRLSHLNVKESKMALPESINIALPQENILVVHNDRSVRRRFLRILNERYNVSEADNIAKAATILDSGQVNLVIADFQIKDAHNINLCKLIQQNPKWKHASTICVTSETNPQDKVDSFNTGAHDCVSDSCAEAELLARVRSILKHGKIERELVTQLRLLEDYSQRLETSSEQERSASSKLTKKNEELDQMNRKLELSKREIEIRQNQDQLLHEISNTIRKSFDISNNVSEVLEMLGGRFELDCCFVTLPDEDETQDSIRKEYASNEAYRVTERDLDLSIFNIFSENFSPSQALLSGDIKRDRNVEPFRKEVLSYYHIYSLFYVPITYEQKLIGILGGHKCESEAKWTSANQAFLNNVADQIATGVINARLYKRVERQATTDGLTNLFNHRTGQEKLAEQLKVAERYQRHVSVLMIDVDHFKSVNDTYGHPVGDSVLKTVAHLIRRDCRDVDIPIRYGGEEFLLVLPEVNQEGAYIAAERLRKSLSKEAVRHDNIELSITASMGIATFPDDSQNQHHLLEMADKALYMSKRLGRNQVHVASDLLFNELKEEEDKAAAAKEAAEIKPVEAKAEAAPDDSVMVPEVVEMVKAMASALYAKSEYNKVHHLETARFSEMVAKVLGLSHKQVEQVRLASLLHDVGLLSVPEEIINREGQVSPDELNILMQHPLLGAQMFRPIDALKDICDILENHHECWDGTGYPHGLKAEEIPLAARIISIVDAYHAMISDRPYRQAMSPEKAKRVLRNGAGTQFDPFLVDIFLAVLTQQEQDQAR